MNFDKSLEIKEIPEEITKQIIDIIFAHNVEFEEIGTKEQYYEYLNTIFPDSVINQVLYHGGGEKFDNFDINKSSKIADYGQGIYLTPDKGLALEMIKSKINYDYYAKVDIRNSIIFPDCLENIDEEYFNMDVKDYIKKHNYDGVIDYVYDYNKNKSTNEIAQVVVFDEKKTFILGGKKDIDCFREHLNNKYVLQ